MGNGNASMEVSNDGILFVSFDVPTRCLFFD